MVANNVKKHATKVDMFLWDKSPEFCKELDRLVEIKMTIHAIHAWLKTKGFGGSYDSVHNWVNNKLLTGEKAEAINILISKYQGLEVYPILVKSIGLLSEQLDQSYEAIATPEARAKIAPQEHLKVIPLLVKEINATVKSYNELMYIKSKKEERLAGAYMLQEELMKAFEENPTLQEAVSEICRGTISGMEDDDF